jgi:hypothetical protein
MDRRRPMPRPLEGPRRDRLVAVRFSDFEIECVDLLAKRVHRTRSEVIRDVVSGAIRRVVEVARSHGVKAKTLPTKRVNRRGAVRRS